MTSSLKGHFLASYLHADMDLLKTIPVEILLNFGNYFCTLQFGS